MWGWFGKGASNYAIVTGRVSGVVVVDVDDRALYRWVRWNLPRTPWITKTGKGCHLFFRFSPWVKVGNRVRVAGMPLDVRGDGGYVIGPGSVHASGARYERRGDWSVPRCRLPVFPAALLEPSAPPRPTAPPPKHRLSSLEERARRYLAKIPAPIEGQGSDLATFTAACRLVRGFGLVPSAATNVLRAWAPMFDPAWIARKVDAASQYATEKSFGYR